MVLWTQREIEMFYASRGVMLPQDAADVMKSAGIIGTDMTPEYFNPIYGSKAFFQLNREVNNFSVLPKEKWTNYGVRIITALDEITPIGEKDTLPNNPTYPNIVTYKVLPKAVVNEFSISMIEEYVATHGYDDVYGAPDQLRELKMTEHILGISKMIGKAATDITDETKEFTPLDKIVSGYGETHLIGNAVDVYGLDRHTAPSILDSYVDAKADAADPARTLTSDMLLSAITNIQKNCGEEPEFILTGYYSWQKIIELFENYVRYPAGGGVKWAKVQGSVNGVKTAEGNDFGVKAAYIYGIPVIKSQFVANSGAGTSENIYFLNTKSEYGLPRLSFRLMFPTMYFESNNPLIVDRFGRRGVYYTAGELVCRRFNAQGKIRDIAL